jgi:hypothetical protein
MGLGFKNPPYPAILTDADWQKKKGKSSALAGKTGVGDLMDKAEAAYKAVKWHEIVLFGPAMPQGNARREGDGERAYQTVMKACAQPLRTLELALSALEKKATATAAVFKKNKLIHADSSKHALAVAKAADDFRNAVAAGTVSEFLKGQREQIEKDFQTTQAQMADGLNKLKRYVDGFKAAIQGKKLEDYNSLWAEHIRGVGTQLAPLAKRDPAFDPDYQIWRKYSNKEVTPPSEKEFNNQMQILLGVIGKLKPKLDKL